MKYSSRLKVYKNIFNFVEVNEFDKWRTIRANVGGAGGVLGTFA